MIMTAVPTLFYNKGLQRELEGKIQSMQTITNKGASVSLDNETLYVSGLLVDTMLFLYDSQGELCGKCKFTMPSVTLTIPKKGAYVLVMSHPNCQPEVRRIVYSNI